MNYTPLSLVRRDPYSGSILSRATGRESLGGASRAGDGGDGQGSSCRGSDEGGGGGGGVGAQHPDRGRGWVSLGEGGGGGSPSSNSSLLHLMRTRTGPLPRMGPRTCRTFIVQEFCQRGERNAQVVIRIGPRIG